MAKKLGKVLKDVLDKPLEEAVIATVAPADYDVRYQAHMTKDSDRRSPSFSDVAPEMQTTAQEPEDKILIAIQHLFINGEFEQANALIKEYGGRGLFTWHHMQQLVDWVRNIYKYTNMRDLNNNYYNYQVKQRMDGVDNIEKVRIKDETVDKFTKDVQRVLKKKLAMY